MAANATSVAGTVAHTGVEWELQGCHDHKMGCPRYLLVRLPRGSHTEFAAWTDRTLLSSPGTAELSPPTAGNPDYHCTIVQPCSIDSADTSNVLLDSKMSLQGILAPQYMDYPQRHGPFAHGKITEHSLDFAFTYRSSPSGAPPEYGGPSVPGSS